MKFKLSIIICIFFLHIQLISAQPSAPTSNGLGYAKFIDFPVSPFTGTFSYSVPLATVSSGSLALPVSLDYHSGGNRVGDPASNVGLGWNLNYGGSITRTVGGVPDEVSGKGYWSNPTPNVQSIFLAEDEAVAEGNQDGEPDIFTWSAGGEGGKFFMDRNQVIVSITKTNAKIEKLGSNLNLGFKITLSSGSEYYFTLINTQNKDIVPDPGSGIVGFNLTKIRSFDAKDSIVLFYKSSLLDEIYMTKAIAMPIKIATPNSANVDISNNQEEQYISRQKVLDFIQGTNNKITIEYATRNDLQAISGYPNNVPLRISALKYENGSYCIKQNLTHSYFKDSPSTTNPYHQRLKLDGVQKVTCQTSTNTENPITFEYNGPVYSGVKFFPSIYDKNIDHFGYYNKKALSDNNTANCDMIQTTTLQYSTHSATQGNANRSPHAISSLIGQLEQVHLPTKSTIKYFYEPNTVNSTGSFSATAFSINCVCTNSPVSVWHAIDVDKKNSGIINLIGTSPSINSSCGTYSPKYVYLKVFNSSNVQIYSTSLMGFSASFNMSVPINTISQIIVGENYRFEVSTSYCDGAANLIFTNSGNVEAPGNRIKEILITDNLNTNSDIIKRYDYNKFSASNQSSGILVNVPQYGLTSGLAFIFSAHSLKSLQNIDGYGVGYENVTIDFNGIGKEKLTFYKEASPQAYTTFPYPPSQVQMGRQLKSEKLDGYNIAVSFDENIYDESNSLSDYFHRSMHTYSNFESSSSFRLKTNRWVRVTSQTSITDGVTTTTNHIYNTSANPAILGPVESSMTNSDGKVTKTHTRYTSQYDPYTTQAVTDVKNALIARNIIIPYEVRVEVDGVNFLSGSRTEFSLFHPTTGTTLNVTASTGIPRPSREMKYERTWDSAGALQAGTWTEQKKFAEYAFKGKLTKYNDFGYSDKILEYDPVSYNVTKNSFIDHHTQYEYYPNSTLLKKVIDIDGTNVNYEYDALIRMFKTIDNSKQISKTYSYYFGNGTANDRHKTTVTTSFQGTNNSNSALTDMEDITYYDNLERTIQVVKKGQSPTNKDVITSIEYDKYGRVTKEYLPVEGTGSTGAYLPIVTSWKHSLTIYESSPLSRKLSVLPPDWHATTYSYGSNTTANDGAITDPKSGSSFAQNTLYKTITTDANGNKSISFSDRKGRTVLTAQYSGTTLAASTASQKKIIQNVYDLKDRLEAVVVPGATWTTGTDLNYYYRYDGEDKLIYKKLPSRGDIHYIYNSRDLTAGWRDNNVGATNWFSTLYDAYGRSLKTGFASTSGFDVNNPNIISHYTLNIYGTTGIDKGKIKSAQTQIIGTQQYLITNYVYDPTTGRLQSTSGNHHLNIGNVTNALTSSYIYDKGGNVTNTNTGIISASGQANLPVNYIDKYDHIGRNTENIFQYNNGTQTTLSKQIYNHREELIAKYQGKTGLTGVNEYLQEMNFTYLTNGLLKTINQPNTLGMTAYNVCSAPNPTNYSTYNEKDLFYLELYYDTPISGSNAISRKNGEISGARWQTKGRNFQNYAYTYDYLGQLKEAKYYDFNHGPNQLVATDRYTLQDINYDVRGNITSLKRYGVFSSTQCGTANLVDNLSYTYTGQTGNRLSSIADAVGTNPTGILGFKPATGTYSYDANGNITADPYKSITSTIYNVFDKPSRINKADGQYITFTYDGSGNMLTKSIFNASNVLLEKRDD